MRKPKVPLGEMMKQTGVAIILLACISFLYSNCGAFRASDSNGFNLSSVSESTLRRLTNDEINRTLTIILEDSAPNAQTYLPKEQYLPYDNDVAAQVPSAPLIQGLEDFAASVSQKLVGDQARRERVVGCTPANATDQNCMTSFVRKIGRLFFRRTLSTEEVTSLVGFAIKEATQANRFEAGIEMLVRALIQHPNFLYRIEAPGKASSTEVAARLAFFLWGSGPDDQLIQMGESGQLSSVSQIRAVATNMLNSPRAIAQIQKFHAFWLGYGTLGGDTMSTAMRAEADTMVKRVIFDENKPWSELLTTSKTTINSTLGPTYEIDGLTATPTLVDMPANRRGILGTSAFLSVAAKATDTSPTLRGKFIRERLMCQMVPPPPPDVNVDTPPEAPAGQPNCKYNRYDGHRRAGGTCFNCHQMMDPIGFGLERFDKSGKYREYDYNPDGSLKMTCYIEGKGELPGVGNFTGPGELSNRLLESKQIQYCLVKQLYHFGMGRELMSTDSTYAATISKELEKTGSLKDLIVALVTSDKFLAK